MKPAALAAALVLASPALAQFHQGDIAIAPDGNGRILLGTFDESAPFSVDEDCVFSAQLNASGVTSDPGFDSPTGAFNPNATGGLHVLSALRKWNGADFNTVPAERLGLSFGPLVENLSPTSDAFTPGNARGNITSAGEFHNHFRFTLLSPNTDGVYLLHAQLFVTPPSQASSDEFWMLFSKNATAQDTADAEAFVRDTLAWCTDPGFSPADLTTNNTNPGDPAYGQPDGLVNGADLSYYVERWISDDAAVADLTTNNTNPGDPGFGAPDGLVNGADLSYYVELWLQG